MYPLICTTYYIKDNTTYKGCTIIWYKLNQTKSSRIILPEVHGVKKILDTNSLPEKQKTVLQFKKGSEIKPRLGEGRVGIKCKKPQATKNIDELTNCRKY